MDLRQRGHNIRQDSSMVVNDEYSVSAQPHACHSAPSHFWLHNVQAVARSELHCEETASVLKAPDFSRPRIQHHTHTIGRINHQLHKMISIITLTEPEQVNEEGPIMEINEECSAIKNNEEGSINEPDEERSVIEVGEEDSVMEASEEDSVNETNEEGSGN